MTTTLAAVTTLAARQVLTAAADVLETQYPAARLTSWKLLNTIRQAADQLLPSDVSAAYRLAQDATDLLTEYRAALGEDPKALDRWTAVFARVETVAQIRAAATPAVEIGDQA